MTQDDRIATLEARIEELEAEQEKLREELARARLEQWEARADELEVQLHLGAMELRDRLEPIIESVRDQIAEARGRLEDGKFNATEVASALRSGIERAWEDLRSALREAKRTLSS
ncbi:MAG: hypothetical protein N2037_08445 [Acidimicrobiales bacterium]|nr:hypothetical protein [Acidimicrobiales bacterium]